MLKVVVGVDVTHERTLYLTFKNKNNGFNVITIHYFYYELFHLLYLRDLFDLHDIRFVFLFLPPIAAGGGTLI